MKTDQELEIEDTRRRLANARRRVAYWSGRPSFRDFGYRPSNSRSRLGNPDFEYEMALDDVRNLAKKLSKFTGRNYVVSDLKEKFNSEFSMDFRKSVDS